MIHKTFRNFVVLPHPLRVQNKVQKEVHQSMTHKRVRNNDERLAERIASIIAKETNLLLLENEEDTKQLLENVFERLKRKKLCSENVLLKLNEDEWLMIYKFIGFENIFYNQIYKINKEMMGRLYENSSFWINLFRFMWNSSMKIEEHDSGYIRKCCFHKFYSFERQKLENIHCSDGRVDFSIISHLNCNAFKNDIRFQTVHIVKNNSPCYNLILNDVEGLYQYANIDWVLNVYLWEKPICVSLSVKGTYSKNRNIDIELDIKAKIVLNDNGILSDQWIDIFGDSTIPILGIKKLFESLKLDESRLLKVPGPETFTFLTDEFPETFRKDALFLWFCQEFLSQIPSPFSDIFKNCPNDNHEFLITDEQEIQELLESL